MQSATCLIFFYAVELVFLFFMHLNFFATCFFYAVEQLARSTRTEPYPLSILVIVVVVVVVITHLLPGIGGTSLRAIQLHAANPIELG